MPLAQQHIFIVNLVVILYQLERQDGTTLKPLQKYSIQSFLNTDLSALLQDAR